MTLGNRLRSLRERAKYKPSVAQVAKRLGISKQHLSNIETGNKKPGRDLLLRIADYYRVSLDDLVHDEEETEALTNLRISEENSIYEIQVKYDATSDLQPKARQALDELALVFKQIEIDSKRNALEDLIVLILGDIEERFGEKSDEELAASLDLFARSGDESALRSWFDRYLGSNNLLPN